MGYLKPLESYIDEMLPVHREVARQFCLHLKSQDLSYGRIKHYLITLRALSHFLGDKRFEDVTKNDIVNFIISLQDRYEESTINVLKVMLKRFYKWLLGNDEIYPQCVKWIKVSKIADTKVDLSDILSREEIRKLIETARSIRDKAIVAMMYESAARLDEFRKLKIKDVKIDEYGAVIILRGKTGKRRIRLIESAPYLQMWLNVHPYRDDPNAYLFPGEHKYKPRCKFIYKYTLVNLAKQAGIKKHVHPHLLRHSRLTELAKILTEQELKLFAGWSKSSRMPAVYVHLSGRDLEPKLLEYYGIKEAEKPQLNDKPKRCPRCNTLNQSNAKFCFKCGLLLDESRILESLNTEEKIIEIIKQIIVNALKNDETKREIILKILAETVNSDENDL